MKLRDWQHEAVNRYQESLRQGARFMLLEAAPGAGKTNAALAVCRDQLRRRGRPRVIVVVPTRHLTGQWAGAAQRWQIHLHHGRDAGSWWSADYDGVVVTYQQVAQRPDYFSYHSRDALVVLDEIHHAGDGLTWGSATRQGFAEAGFVLALSGTPFRSDQNAIPFVRWFAAGILPAQQTRGVADVIALSPEGRFAAFEIKRAGKRAGKDQIAFLDEVRARGGIAGVIDSLESLEKVLHEP